jgi:hypothetical protein
MFGLANLTGVLVKLFSTVAFKDFFTISHFSISGSIFFMLGYGGLEVANGLLIVFLVYTTFILVFFIMLNRQNRAKKFNRISIYNLEVVVMHKKNGAVLLEVCVASLASLPFVPFF